MSTQNPYIPSSSVLYYGREDEEKRLREYALAGQSVLLIAGRGMGKTRILQRLVNAMRIKRSARFAVTVSMRQCSPTTVEDIYFFFLDNIARQLGSSATLTCSNRPSGDDFIRELCRLVGFTDNGLALLVDDADHLVRYGELADRYFVTLRHILDYQIRGDLFVVLAGGRPLREYKNPRDSHSPALNLSTQVHLFDLNPGARRTMASQPFVDANRRPLPDEVLRELDLRVGGHPYLLARFLEELWRYSEISISVLRDVEKRVVGERDDLVAWCNDIGSGALKIYEAICLAGRMSSYPTSGDNRLEYLALRYTGLIHDGGQMGVEPGPLAFRDWAIENGRIQKQDYDRHACRARYSEHSPELYPGYYSDDLAISYASENREIAQAIVEMLEADGYRIFYDLDRTSDLWARDLSDYLPALFNRRARRALVLLSEPYAKKRWPGIEWAAIADRIAREGGGNVLVAGLDGTALLAGGADCGYLELQKPADLARVIKDLKLKLGRPLREK